MFITQNRAGNFYFFCFANGCFCMPRLAVGIRITTKPCGEFHSFFVLQMVVFRMPRLAMGIYCSSDCALV